MTGDLILDQLVDLVVSVLAACGLGLCLFGFVAILNCIRERFAERARGKRVPRSARMTQQQHSDILKRMLSPGTNPTDIYMSLKAANRFRELHGLPPFRFCERCSSDPCQCKPQAAE